MGQTLDFLEPSVAAGVLARAALALESAAENPAARPVVEGELAIRELVISSARKSLGLSGDDYSAKAVTLICESLDNTADELAAKPDLEAAALRLAERGDLPSDRFEVRIIDNVRQFYGKLFDGERVRIEETVHGPDIEQHFGKAAHEGEPDLISLFARFYPGQYPHRSFYLLVAGQREGLVMHVHQAWRLYPSLIEFSPSPDLVGMLRSFAEVYGGVVKVGDAKGKLIIDVALPPGTRSIRAELPHAKPGQKPHLFLTSFFNQKSEATQDLRASLVVSIDLTEYEKVLKKMHWEEPPLPRWRPGDAPLSKPTETNIQS